ncbi:SCO family protein [Massilia sp. DWR3-1-1]|uniref:SCO family protein n=1 Tax=Massilia sp. DWR3-1-1 TaxID=2804559 RepID=UPI003CFAF08E
MRAWALLALALAGLAGFAPAAALTAALTASFTPTFTPATAASTTQAGLALPAPGSYTLDRIMAAPQGLVQDSDGSAHRLAEFTTGRITLFSFVYTACSDARGCPLAMATMHTLKAAIAADAALRGQVRLVSMSFDPDYDTPPVMRSYGGQDARSSASPRWYFLTCQSSRQLAPVLAGFGQDVRVAQAGGAALAAATNGAGERPLLSHLLKIYLLDARGQVREIYSPAFLQPATMLNDIRTLAAEAGALAPPLPRR